MAFPTSSARAACSRRTITSVLNGFWNTAQVPMQQGNSAESIELGDHLTTRPGGLRRLRTRSILYAHLSLVPGLDSSRNPASMEALADFTFGNASPRRNTQWLTLRP
jgi:hypothetical protein